MQPLRPVQVKFCQQCKLQYTLSKSLSKRDRENSRFCGRECYWQWMRDNITPPSQLGRIPWNKDQGKNISCLECHSDFWVITSRIETARYCSKKCLQARRVEIHCQTCQVSFFTKKSQLGIKKYCSKECMNEKLSLMRRGENAPGWKGGVTATNALIRSSRAYRIWRKSVFERDNYTCQFCKQRNGNGKTISLEADHIKPFAYYPKLRFEINNGRTLCKECHMTTDTYLRKGKYATT